MGNVSYRCKALDMAGLAAAEIHGKRLDETSQRRAVHDVSPLLYKSLDLRAAYDEHTQNVMKAKNAKKTVLHCTVQFPTSWEITPEIEQQMLSDAIEFVNNTHGGNAVFAARLDRDEKGKHLVDVFATPLFVKTNVKRKSTEMWMSATKHGKQIAEKHRDEIISRNPKGLFSTSPRNVGIAMQSELFSFLKAKYGDDIKPKNAKKSFSNDWLSPEAYQVKKASAFIEVLHKKYRKATATLKHLTSEVLEEWHNISPEGQKRFHKGFTALGTISKKDTLERLNNTAIASTAQRPKETPTNEEQTFKIR